LFHRLALAAFASVFVVSAAPPAELPPNTLLVPGTYAGTELRGFTAREAQPLYTDALKQGCPAEAGVDTALAKGPPAGNGVLLGTSDGRIVVSESIHAFPNAKAARKFVTTARSSSGCLGYAGRDSVNRVIVQYPQLPPFPTFVHESSREAGTVFATFAGTSAAAPLEGSTALVVWDHFVAEATIRIAVPRPGELDALSRSIFASIEYDGRSATGAATNPKFAQQADALAKDFLARVASSTAFGLQPSTRSGVASNPPSCAAATDAYVHSGVHGAVRGFAGQDPTTHIAAKPEIIVFPTAADADRYLKSYGDLSSCFTDLNQAGLPPGSTVKVEREPLRGTGSLSKTSSAKIVSYLSTLEGPNGAQLGKNVVAVITTQNRAAFLFAQLISSDATVDIGTQLDQLARDLGAVLSQK